MPNISIIVPVYKVEKYLSRCVESILIQTYTDFEIILVDDGSPDRCGALCDEYAKKEKRIVVLHRENGGLSAARNMGIDWTFENSDSLYLTFIDSDDWIHPQYLEELLNAVEKHHVPVSVCFHDRVEQYDISKMQLYGESLESKLMSAEELLLDYEWNFNYAWGKLYRKEYFQKIRYPVGKNFEDVFTTYRVLFLKNQVALVDRELYFYFLNHEGISRSPWNPEELVVFEGMQQQITFYRENGYERALEKEEQLFVNHYAYQICRIRENKNEWKQNHVYVKQLRKEMMKYVHQQPDKFGYRKMPQCYEAAYPKAMRIYHWVGSVWRKVTNMIRR